MRRQVAVEELLEARAVEHLAEARAHRDPHGRQVLGDALVRGVLRPQPAHLGERAVDRTEHVAEGDLRSRTGEDVATPRPATARDEPGDPQLEEDGLEELVGEGLPSREQLRGEALVARRPGVGERQHRPDGVVGAGRDAEHRAVADRS